MKCGCRFNLLWPFTFTVCSGAFSNSGRSRFTVGAIIIQRILCSIVRKIVFHHAARDKSVISGHLSNIYKEGELDKEATVAKNATVQIEAFRPAGVFTRRPAALA